MSRWLRLRTAFDRLVAAGLLVFTAPVIAVLAWVTRRADGHPGLIRLRRAGQGGTEFSMWKLRTMRPADPSAGGATITSGDDDRVTPLGRTLRHYRLDELPNLLDVVAGRMALLGPRPETPGMVDATDPRWQQVLEARPAIAGPTQLVCADWETAELRTGDAEDVYRLEILPVKLAVDAWYVQRATPAIDATVLVSLVQRFAFGRRETLVHRRVRREVPAASVVPVPAGDGR